MLPNIPGLQRNITANPKPSAPKGTLLWNLIGPSKGDPIFLKNRPLQGPEKPRTLRPKARVLKEAPPRRGAGAKLLRFRV